MARGLEGFIAWHWLILRMCLWLFLCVFKGCSKEILRAGGGCVFQGYRRVSVFTGRVGWCEAVDLGLES